MCCRRWYYRTCVRDLRVERMIQRRDQVDSIILVRETRIHDFRIFPGYEGGWLQNSQVRRSGVCCRITVRDAQFPELGRLFTLGLSLSGHVAEMWRSELHQRHNLQSWRNLNSLSERLNFNHGCCPPPAAAPFALLLFLELGRCAGIAVTTSPSLDNVAAGRSADASAAAT